MTGLSNQVVLRWGVPCEKFTVLFIINCGNWYRIVGIGIGIMCRPVILFSIVVLRKFSIYPLVKILRNGYDL